MNLTSKSTEVTDMNQADRNQRQKNIAYALTLLPSEQCKVVFMSFFQDKSHGEISEELQIPQ